MNQILYNKIKDNLKKENKLKLKRYRLQFFLSSILFFIILELYFFRLQIRNFDDASSKQIASNYNILRLYKNTKSFENNIYNQNGKILTIIGMIEIPKINIYYPILSESTEEFLKISPCRVSGPMPNEEGNLCIAGHNYDNYKFFSKVSNLELNDEIIIYDINGEKKSYIVYKKYEVPYNDLSPLEVSDDVKKQITLITCNNFNSNTRIIVKANMKN